MPDILPTGTDTNPVNVAVLTMPEGGGSLTDAELRASPVPVSGTVAVSNHPSSVQVSNFPATQTVSGPLTDAQLRASAVPVSLASVPSHPVTVVVPALQVRNGTRVAAPAANAVLADTGQLPAGSYRVEWDCVAMDTLAVGKGCIVEHRNAANNANIAVLGGCAAGESQADVEDRVVVALNERIRVTAGSAGGAASSLYGGRVAVYPVS